MSNHPITEPAKKNLTVDEFLSRVQPASKNVYVEGLGDVSIRAITLKEREEIKSGSTNTLTEKVDEASFIALTVIKGMVEPRLTPTHVAQLQQSNFGLLAKISKQIWNLSGVNEDVKNA